jgi:phage gpG-like protein
MLRAQFDLSSLHALEEQVGRLAAPALLRSLNDRLASAALVEVGREFEEARDPQGQPWAPLRSRVGRPLNKTGALAHSFGSRSSGQGFSLGSSLSFAGFHQEGTSRLPPRPMLPEGEPGPLWSQALEQEIDAAVERLFGSGG